MPAYQYAPNAHRSRRFTQYVAFFDAAGEMTLKRLPHRPFIQSASYNPLSGGILREFEPIEAQYDIKSYIQQLFDLLEIDRSRNYHLDVHQYRVYGLPESQGTSVPEGPHRDGMECVAILVLERKGITDNSAEFSLIDPKTREAFVKTVVGKNEGIALYDRDMLHDAAPIVASGIEPGFRDYIVVNVNQMAARRYGREHEQKAMGRNVAAWVDPFAQLKRQRLLDSIEPTIESARLQIVVGSPRALNTIDSVEAKLRSAGRDGIHDVTAQSLIARDLKRQAIAERANFYFRKARLRQVAGSDNSEQIHRVHKLLREYRSLTGRHGPNKEQGFGFDARALKRCEAKPLIWKLEARARTPERRDFLERSIQRRFANRPEIRALL